MKTRNLLYTAINFAIIFTSCSDFLDTMPDNRAEIDTESKITSLLVSAYPGNTDIVITEMASDNAMDNGTRFTVESQEHEDAYLWNDITGTGNDSPKSFWDACYGAIAAANHALASIEEMGNPVNLNAQRGEALMCRAYGHFALANVFCLPYNPNTAEYDLGIPYSEAPETEVSPQYERGNMKDLYAKINADIEAGLSLIDDDIYSVPKYHFNRKAAHAFATRFNLYYHNYDKAIQYANVVLGSVPGKMMKNWNNIVINTASNWSVRVDMYISASEAANLLLLPVTSSWGYWGGPYDLGRRYGHAKVICTSETGRVNGMWGTYSNLLPFRNMWGFDEKMATPKIGGYFYYTDKVNGIGYRKNVILAFSADETLLCRAEAYALKGEAFLDKATEDINVWLSSHTLGGLQVTTKEIVDFYGAIDCMPLDNSKRTIKKKLNPRGFTVIEGNQMEMIQCILHLRRIETIHEGLRWQDIKRYGIEISHNRDGLADDILTVDDPRRAIQLPQDVVSAGLEANPRN